MSFGVQNRNCALLAKHGRASIKLSSEVAVVKRNGQTTICTGQGNEKLSLQRFADGTANVSVNGENTELSQEEAENLVVDTGDGNDNIEISGKGARGQTLTLKGGSGNDVIDGGRGNDFFDGDSGIDFFRSGSDNDVINSDKGNDFFGGDSGTDFFKSRPGNDVINSDKGNDFFCGDSGTDFFKSRSDNDTLTQDSGNSGKRGQIPGAESLAQLPDDANLDETVKSDFSGIERLVQRGKTVEQIASNLSPGSNLEAIERVGYSYDLKPEDLLNNKNQKKLVESLRNNKLISRTPLSYGIKKLIMAAVPDNLITQSALKVKVTKGDGGGYDMEVYSLEKNGVGWEASPLGDKISEKIKTKKPNANGANWAQLYGQGRSIAYSGVKDLYHFESPAEVDKALNYFRRNADISDTLPVPYDKDGLRLPTAPRPDIEIGPQKPYASPENKQFREFLSAHKTGRETVTDGHEFRGDAHASVGFGNFVGYEGRALGYWHSGVRSEGDKQTEYETGGWKLSDRVRSRISPLKMSLDSTYSTWKISHVSGSSADGSKYHEKSELVFSNSGLDTDVEIDSDKANKQQIKITIDPNKILQKPGENPLVSEPGIISWVKEVFSGESNNSPELTTPEQKSQYVKSMMNEMLDTKVKGDAAGKVDSIPWLPGPNALKAASNLIGIYGSKELDAELDSVVHGEVPVNGTMDLPLTRKFLNTVFGESAVRIDITQNEIQGDAGNIWQSEPFYRDLPIVTGNIWTMQMSTLSSQQIMDSKTIHLEN